MDTGASELSSSLLVAMPQLDDPNFHRAVVLLVHHASDGSFGLVLNRSLDLSVTEVLEQIGIAWPSEVGTVAWGGPVEPDHGWVLLAADPPAGGDEGEIIRVRDGMCLTGSVDVLRAIAVQPPEELRFFLGYAGWGAGQLEAELAEGAWLLAPLRREVVFTTGLEMMWETAVRGLGVEPTALVPTRGVH